ncbi:DUF2585 family protein [Erythrobacter arachoides]|uniref:DUF2585 family protein n=1 Tax=Aurantiacibacter arachoides TaxID=1850444 RepID=A0A845A2S6_9SPHN|nr:DUF2585 family protein [Aurantiacibacter arachoides]MXO94004.1 DUF2585 family protein [Aurantiacibacter arachoides]GGD44877.1 UPF0314 protein [Aurantiacibacter arachoides]
MERLLPHHRAWLASIVVALIAVAVLFAMGRPPICTCGTIELWHGQVQSAGNSQHIADWYAPSHFTHGLIMAGIAWLLWQRWRLFGGAPQRWAMPIAVLVESLWEISENTPTVIDRYREATAAFGYSGDSIVNSAADIGWMVLGFLVAVRLPWWASVALGLGLELLALWAIRDNLTLNVIMLAYPVDAIRDWQASGGAL